MGIQFELMAELLSMPTRPKSLTARELAQALGARGVSCDKSTANSMLYQMEKNGLVRRTEGTPPTWSLASNAEYEATQRRTQSEKRVNQRRAKSERSGRRPTWPNDLRAWQAEALDAWFDAGCIGVVQAVTGTGKTRVGLQAAKWHVANGGKVLILVPSRALQAQWHRQLVSEFGGIAGQRGDGHRDTFRTRTVIVSTVHSAIEGLDLLGDPGLLIADECHRYGAETWSQALDDQFELRLGLSATYARGDSGDADYLHPYFGADPVFDMDFRRAIDERVVVPFRLAFVGVPLTPPEQSAYDEHAEVMSRAKSTLVKRYGFPAEPPAEFMKAVAKAAQGEDGFQIAMVAQRYVSAFAKKRAVLADSTEKLAVLERLAPVMSPDAGTLVFTQTKAAAEESATRLASATGRKTAAIYGELDGSERERLLEAFRQRDVPLLSAPRVLDEGIDVPDADLGIVVASSSSRRQMIQRMGRVLRTSPSKVRARMVILFAQNTTEDPANGAHEGFITIAGDVAEERKIFRAPIDVGALCEFLRPESNGRRHRPAGEADRKARAAALPDSSARSLAELGLPHPTWPEVSVRQSQPSAPGSTVAPRSRAPKRSAWTSFTPAEIAEERRRRFLLEQERLQIELMRDD